MKQQEEVERQHNHNRYHPNPPVTGQYHHAVAHPIPVSNRISGFPGSPMIENPSREHDQKVAQSHQERNPTEARRQTDMEVAGPRHYGSKHSDGLRKVFSAEENPSHRHSSESYRPGERSQHVAGQAQIPSHARLLILPVQYQQNSVISPPEHEKNTAPMP